MTEKGLCMSTSDDKKRGCDMRVRVTEDVYKRFSALAERIGMPPSTLASYAVGHYLKSQEDGVRASQMGIMQMMNKMGEQIDAAAALEIANQLQPVGIAASGIPVSLPHEVGVEGGGNTAGSPVPKR